MNVKISNGWIEVRSAGESVRRYSTSPLTWLLMALVFVVSFQVVKTAELIPYLQRAVSETNPSIALTGGKHCIQSLASNVETALTSTPVSQDCLLPSIRLTTPVNTLVDMQRSLEHGDPNLGHEDGGDQPYYKATVQFDGQPLQRCKICLRGTMPWHHHIEKPSLRIKLKTEDMRGGDRYIELTRPEDALAVKNWLPMQLASEVGLLSDQSDHVRVFVNNKYLGLYVRAMRQGEPLALTNHRMPGTFFKGDSEGDLWSSLDDWKMNGEMADEDQAVFRQFLALLEPPTTQAKLDRLRIVFDFEVYARWAALMAVTGSLHTDAVHNHAYFFCANQGKIESIPWDCNSFGMHAEPQTPVDTSPHRVIRALLCDPNWVHRRNQWIYKLVTGAASAEQLIKRVDDHLQRVGAELVSDRNTAENRLTYVGWHFIPASPSQLKRHRDELADWIRARQVFLLQYLNHASVYVQRKANSDQGSVICVDGNAAIRIDTVAENGLAIRSQVVLPSLSEEAQTFTSIPYEEPLEVPYLTSVPRQLLVDGNASTLRFFNAITMRPIEPKISAVPIELTDQRSRTLHNDLRPDEDGIANPRVIRLGPGSVDLREDLVITSHQRLIIEPGTQIGLAASVGIYCEGMMTALGSELQPITFQRLNDDKPWARLPYAGPSQVVLSWPGAPWRVVPLENSKPVDSRACSMPTTAPKLPLGNVTSAPTSSAMMRLTWPNRSSQSTTALGKTHFPTHSIWTCRKDRFPIATGKIAATMGST